MPFEYPRTALIGHASEDMPIAGRISEKVVLLPIGHRWVVAL